MATEEIDNPFIQRHKELLKSFDNIQQEFQTDTSKQQSFRSESTYESRQQQNTVQKQSKSIFEMQEIIEQKNLLISQLQVENLNLSSGLASRKYQDQELLVSQQREQIQEKNYQLQELKRQNTYLQQQLQSQQLELSQPEVIENNDQQVQVLQSQLQEQTTQMSQYINQIQEQQDQIQYLQTSLVDSQQKMEILIRENTKLARQSDNQQLDQIDSKNAESSQDAAKNRLIFKRQDQLIQQLQAQVSDLKSQNIVIEQEIEQKFDQQFQQFELQIRQLQENEFQQQLQVSNFALEKDVNQKELSALQVEVEVLRELCEKQKQELNTKLASDAHPTSQQSNQDQYQEQLAVCASYVEEISILQQQRQLLQEENADLHAQLQDLLGHLNAVELKIKTLEGKTANDQEKSLFQALNQQNQEFVALEQKHRRTVALLRRHEAQIVALESQLSQGGCAPKPDANCLAQSAEFTPNQLQTCDRAQSSNLGTQALRKESQDSQDLANAALEAERAAGAQLLQLQCDARGERVSLQHALISQLQIENSQLKCKLLQQQETLSASAPTGKMLDLQIAQERRQMRQLSADMSGDQLTKLRKYHLKAEKNAKLAQQNALNLQQQIRELKVGMRGLFDLKWRLIDTKQVFEAAFGLIVKLSYENNTLTSTNNSLRNCVFDSSELIASSGQEAAELKSRDEQLADALEMGQKYKNLYERLQIDFDYLVKAMKSQEVSGVPVFSEVGSKDASIVRLQGKIHLLESQLLHSKKY